MNNSKFNHSNDIQAKKASLADIISGLFIILFVYAAINKFSDVQKFEVQLGKSPMLLPIVHVTTWGLPSIEIAIALAFIFKATQRAALYASFCLMIMFTTYIVIILNFSENIPCSCGGILENMTWGQHLVFNCIFIIIGAIGIMTYPLELRSIAIEGDAENLNQSRQKIY